MKILLLQNWTSGLTLEEVWDSVLVQSDGVHLDVAAIVGLWGRSERREVRTKP